MKIAFLTSRTDKASARYRFVQYLPRIEASGIECEVMTIPMTFGERGRFFKGLAGFDAVFLQKRLFSLFDCYRLTTAAKKIIYDFDDAVMFRDSWRGSQRSLIRASRFRRIVRRSDAVVAGNEYLAAEARVYNRNTFVIPTPIDMKRYTEKVRTAGGDGTVTLGWIGSAKTVGYLERIKGVLDKVHRMYPETRLKMVSDRFLDPGEMPVDKKVWSYDEEVAELKTFDIGLMPLTLDPWTRGKCGFKLLQYMATGVPAVCSPVGVNSEIVSHGVNGMLAVSDGDWVSSLGALIEDFSLREAMGKEARRTVASGYSLDVNAPKLIELLKKVAGEKGDE